MARLAQAEHFERLLRTGAAQHKAELAKRYGLARSRVTQLMSLLQLGWVNRLKISQFVHHVCGCASLLKSIRKCQARTPASQ